ncbi:Lcl C-terminal domain-containing protein [Parabacteroides sp.]
MYRKLTTMIPFIGLLLLLASCQDELPDKGMGTEGTGTVTLTFTPEVGKMVNTRSEVRPSTPGGEAEKAGFSYEMVVTAIDSTGPATKAMPASFKNARALLFASNGEFNGHADIGTFQSEVPLTATFTDVKTTNATNCRLVLVADDVASTENLVNSTSIASYIGNYTTFCSAKAANGSNCPNINVSKVKKDADIPYVGSVTGVNLTATGTTGSATATVNSISLYRMLAKVSVSVKANMPEAEFQYITASSVYFTPFGTPNEYDGSGRVLVADTTVSYSSVSRSTSAIFYLGEKIMKERTEIVNYKQRSFIDYPNSPVLRIVFAYSDTVRSAVQPGEEFTYGGDKNEFEFDIVLGSDGPSDYSVRRNHSYDITVNLNGTRADFIAQSTTDRRIRPYIYAGKQHHGLCVGRFGGFVASATGTTLSSVKGHYTKMLLLAANESQEIGVNDSKTYVWNASPSSAIQTDMRRFWDYDYIKGLDGGSGGMSTAAEAAYYYCKNYYAHGSASDRGLWYVPTIQQLSAIQILLDGMKGDPVFGYYSGFSNSYYWSSSEYNNTQTYYIYFDNGTVYYNPKTSPFMVRCVRDL